MAASHIDPIVFAAVTSSVARCIGRRGATLPMPAGSELSEVARYWASAVAIAGEDLALQVANDLPIGAFGLVSYSAISAQTMGAAIETFGRDYIGRIIPGMTLRILPVDRNLAEIRLQSAHEHALMPLLEEFVLAVIYRHQAVLPTPASIHAVALHRAAPSDASPWRQYFGVTPRFRQRYSTLRLVATDLQLPLRTASSELHTMVGGVADRPDASLTAAVRTYVRAHLAEPIHPDAIASAVGVTTRTLQRKLKNGQTSLRALTTAVRIEVAREMLEHTETPIAEIALAIGFARPASFSRAFATVTGEAPLDYRKRHQESL